MNAAELSHGAIRRGGRVVLRPGSVPLPASGVGGIVGVNGAGKSTLFHALAGLLRSGTALVRASGRVFGPGAAYAPQEPAFPDWLDVADVVRLYGWNITELARRAPGLLLEEVQNQAVHALSAGQRQALSIALALGAETGLTLLDEPFAPLDFRRRIALVQLLRAQRSNPRGLTLVSSQSAVDLLDTCDWIVVLRDGGYTHSGATASLTAGIADPAEARQRFEDAVMALLGAASPHRAGGRTTRAGSRRWSARVSEF